VRRKPASVILSNKAYDVGGEGEGQELHETLGHWVVEMDV